MSNKQNFGSALNRPWALVKWGGNQPNGRRPSTTVAYMTDPIRDEAGTITGYEGGIVEFYRARDRVKRKPDGSGFTTIPGEPFARWHFRYSRPRTFAVDDVCAWFPCGKSRDQGPPPSMVNAAKRQVPKNPNEEEAA